MRSNRDAKAPVLVVEDDANLRHALVALLRSIGIEANSVGNGLEALLCVVKQEYKLILMDIEMPIMNGLESTAQIRRFEQFVDRKETVIIAVTGDSSTREKCLLAGMNDYYEKPVQLNSLTKLIKENVPCLLSRK